MSDNSATPSGGIGFSGLLGLLFIGLKLCGVIDWTWGWVLSPFWIPFMVYATLFVVGYTLIKIGSNGER